MTTYVARDGKFDVAIAAGPGVELWPSAGVRALSVLCAEMGLTVGLFGGEALAVRGVIPSVAPGGIVIAEDPQSRLHRIHARAIVKVSVDDAIPDPFDRWNSPGLLTIGTAQRLWARGRLLWGPSTVILGTGNRALRFGSTLLEAGVPEVHCVESHAEKWGAKRFAGWEVERRRFETSGGRVLEARPLSLTPRGPQLWEVRLVDAQGTRVLEVARVVSAGPFGPSASALGPGGVREYPPGSFLFEMPQSAGASRHEDVEGWVLEEERGRWLAGRIIRALVTELGPDRERLDKIYNRARGRLKRYLRHREQPFTPAYQGKWIAPADMNAMRSFSGMPRTAQRNRQMASVECFEEIPCTICQDVCPEDAIQIGRIPRPPATDFPVLNESRCTSCGLCVSACPSAAVVMLHEREERSSSEVTLPWRGKRAWKLGEFATLLNRRGETLGTGRVTALPAANLVQVEVPTHLVWETRGVRVVRSSAATDESFVESFHRDGPPGQFEKVEITFNNERRLVEPGISVSTALFETGHSRFADLLQCPDGSCALCSVLVDGTRKLACRTEVRKGMNVKLLTPPLAHSPPVGQGALLLCPCLGISRETVVDRLRSGKLQSAEAVLSVVRAGDGRCHGRLCMAGFRRVLEEQGLDVSGWIDWRFPWTEWTLGP